VSVDDEVTVHAVQAVAVGVVKLDAWRVEDFPGQTVVF
jgi:hypothetical protein